MRPLRLVLLTALAAIAFGPWAGSDDGEREPRIRVWTEGGPPTRSVDVVFVGDGYQRKHLAPAGKYWRDVERYSSRMLAEPPFAWYRERFNVRAVFLESQDAGCDASSATNEVKTALESSFDSPQGRRLGFQDAVALEKAVRAAGEVDIALVMVNTERYGGL